MNIRGTIFCLLTFFYFLVFLLFICYEIWFIVLHGMLAPRSNIGDGTLLSRIFSMVKMIMVWNG